MKMPEIEISEYVLIREKNIAEIRKTMKEAGFFEDFQIIFSKSKKKRLASFEIFNYGPFYIQLNSFLFILFINHNN